MKKRAVRESVNLYEAKTHLSALVDRAAAGEEIVIAKAGRPKALLVPLVEPGARRASGRGRGQWRVAPDFDEPLPVDLLDRFEGRE